MLIFAPVMIFLATSISIILIQLIVKKVFYTMHYKNVIIKYMIKGYLHYFLEFINILSPLLLMILSPILLQTEGIRHMKTQQFILLDLPCKGKHLILYFFALMCWVCNKSWLWYVQVKITNILQVTFIFPQLYKVWVFSPLVQRINSSSLPLSNIHHQPSQTQQSAPSHTIFC